jgi:large subunit ribosomal protein L30
MKPYLKVRQTQSTIGKTEAMQRIVRGLGLRRLHDEVVVANTPSFRGMVKKVIHMVSVEEVAEAPAKKAPAKKAAAAPAAAKKA